MKLLKILSMIGVGFMLNNCGGNAIHFYKDTIPEANIKEYFNGPIKAWGIVQDWRGRVVRRFDVTMVGKWEGDTGTLTEHFEFYDGKSQDRVWTIKKLSDGKYQGTAPDILGIATGENNGSAIHWDYVMDLPVGDTSYRIRFDDWMWVMNDGVMINRSYLKKFGITVSELTLFMQKQKP
ncbi:MAG: DUF3833 domain-containing protein [Candidatus Symbiobacter sp.]|nr:DUF3833 domain-containing protein [Candidatus Symbiobacter sp.]